MKNIINEKIIPRCIQGFSQSVLSWGDTPPSPVLPVKAGSVFGHRI